MSNARLPWLALLLFVFAAWVGAGCNSRSPGPIGKPSPELMLHDLEGNRFYLSNQKGRVVVLNFWSIHCVPCMQEMPHLERLWRTHRARGLTVVGVCTDGSDGDYVERLVAGLEITYPIVLDTRNTVARRYGVQALPTSFVIDRGGIIRDRIEGYVKGDERSYARKIGALLRQGGTDEN